MVFFKKQTVDALRREELRMSEIELVNHQGRLDYYEATVLMLRKRITRLRGEVSANGGSAGRVSLDKAQ